MLALVILIAVDAGVLVFVLQAISNDELDFTTAVIVSLVAAIGTSLLAAGLTSVMGTLGVVLALILAIGLLGVALSAMLGVEIKRAFLAGAIFMVTHIVTSFMLSAIF